MELIPDMSSALHGVKVGISMSTGPTLIQVAMGVGRIDLLDDLRRLFGLDRQLQPSTAVNVLRYIDSTSTTRMVDFPPDRTLPTSVLTLADYARSIHTVQRFLLRHGEYFEIPRLLGFSNREDVLDLRTVTLIRYSSVERELIWDDPSSSLKMGILTWLRGLLYIALLSGEAELLRQRLAIAQELTSPGGGRLTRLHTCEIEDHERWAVALLTHHIADPVHTGDDLRNLLRSITEDRLTSVSKWQDPVHAYEVYRSSLPASTVSAAPPAPQQKPVSIRHRKSFQDDPRYQSGLTLDDLRSPSRTQDLYGAGVYLDKDRLGVLNKLASWFGKQKKKCSVAQGNFDGAGSLDVDTSVIDHTYVILVIDARDHGKWRQDAIAISPFAGAHAAYYVRSDASERSWQDVLGTGKLSARAFGARRLPFRGRSDLDPYESMELKLKALATCSANSFRDGEKLIYDTVGEAYNVG